DAEIIAAFEAAITERTRAMLVTHMINLNGQILPVQELIALAEKHGIEVMVDGAHSFAQMDFKLPDLGCNIFGTSLHKWTSAPLGNGMLHVAKSKIPEIWPLFGDREYPKDDIRKLEHYGTRNPGGLLGIGAALDFNATVTVARKQARLDYLKSIWTEAVRDHPRIQLNTSLKPGHSCALANVGVEGYTPEGLAETLMKDHGIFTAPVAREALQGVRVTPHLHTTVAQVEAIVVALRKIAE
ncbi:MAG: aminotransferase class V-fold PLP-dependent enzyme, partial [Bacteroidota bacterium]